jgi:hypothetical protein
MFWVVIVILLFLGGGKRLFGQLLWGSLIGVAVFVYLVGKGMNFF